MEVFMPDKDLIDYVDLRIGVDNDGNTVIGPQRPNASINPSPDTQGGGHSGYFSNHPIRGFSQIHASGTGWGKYGQFLISPQIGLAAAGLFRQTIVPIIHSSIPNPRNRLSLSIWLTVFPCLQVL